MKLLVVKPIMTEPRFHFDRTIELSKYIEVIWLCGWMQKKDYHFEDYEESKHRILVLGKGLMGKKFRALINELKFVIKATRQIMSIEAEVVLIHSHRLAFLYPLLLLKQNYVLQLFTTAVNKSRMKRIFWDGCEKLVMLPYKKFFVATPEMIDLFGLKEDNCYVTRWGMRPISVVKKRFSSMSLLYIGVLSGRDIHETIAGLRIFLEKHQGLTVTYSIIGSGKPEYVEELKRAIKDNALEGIVAYHGYLPDNEIVPYFDRCNVGVSYVPITPYYNDVIVTKTAEYMLSGLATIATNTNKNRMMISDVNGVLVSDNPESFAEGLEKIYRRLESYDSKAIVESAREWDLEYNIKNEIVPLLKQIAESKD